VHKSPNSVTQNRDVEIEEQTDRAPGELQVSDHLITASLCTSPQLQYRGPPESQEKRTTSCVDVAVLACLRLHRLRSPCDLVL